jgi:hypothetical protein
VAADIVVIKSDDLARAVDASCTVAVGAQGIVDGGVDARAVEVAVLLPAGVDIISDDLARIVDARGKGASASQRIVDPGVGAAAQEEAVDAAGVEVIPDDLARGVDARCTGDEGGRRIIESEVRGKMPRLGSYRKPCLTKLASK